MSGTVYLVGAGPGDPGLLTVRAAELLASADAVVYDALVHPAIVELAAEGAERRYVGKRGGEPSARQGAISELLVELAGRHERIVRLKGGDPFVFGRGGEEAEVLGAAGVRFEVVPGVTAGVAGPAYAGIPVTHRGLSSSLTLVTGHEDPTKPESDLDWAHLARAGTLVFYMGVRRMEENLRRLVEAGCPPERPAAVIERGTYPGQRTLVGTVSTLAEAARDAEIGAPALVVVGEVVTLRDSLGWFEGRPLFGRRVVVTRARAQASSFAAELEALGAEVLQFPTIRIEPPLDPEPLRRSVREVNGFDWVVFTSVNGVEYFWAELVAGGADARALAGVSLCAIGPATADALRARGLQPDLIPDEYLAEAIAAALIERGPLEGRRVLLPRADIAREALPRLLREQGAEVVVVDAYRTTSDASAADELRSRIDQGEVDLITFTSSSTVRNFVEAVGAEVGGARIASIGPITSGTLREVGMNVDVEALEYTIPGLVAAILNDGGALRDRTR